jgi:hypothetical protein
MYSSHCVHTKAIKTTKKIVSPPCTQGDCQSNSFTCSKLWFHIAKDPHNESYHFSLCVVWPIKRTAESKLHCKKGLSWNHQTVFMSELHSETLHLIWSCIARIIFPVDWVSGFKSLCQLQQWPYPIHVTILIFSDWKLLGWSSYREMTTTMFKF